MKHRQRLLIFRLLFLGFLLLVNGGCSNFANTLRKVTYPPDFKYVSGQELRSDMQRLAFQLQLLDQALTEENAPPSDQQQRVLATLRTIGTISGNLQAGDAGSNHPFLYDHMSNFVNDVGQAYSTASLDPPRYYLAGRVSGSCVNCHRVNR